MVFGREELEKRKGTRVYRDVDGFRVQSLTPSEKIALRANWAKEIKKTGNSPVNYDQDLLVRSLVDEDGKRYLTDSEASFFEDIGDGALIEKLSTVAQLLSGIVSGSVDDYLKNYGTATD